MPSCRPQAPCTRSPCFAAAIVRGSRRPVARHTACAVHPIRAESCRLHCETADPKVDKTRRRPRVARAPPRAETVLQTGPAIIDTLRELRDLNIGVALDDFGTGFSALASLQHLPLTRVKLDQSLIAGIDTDPRALAIASAIIKLCEKLGLEVTAEGIERPQQLRLLQEHRSMCLQGYLISHPIESDSVAAAVANMPDQIQLLSVATCATRESNAASVRAAADERTAPAFEFAASEST
jgi:hypothetical protein